jgi:hypothetical protein
MVDGAALPLLFTRQNTGLFSLGGVVAGAPLSFLSLNYPQHVFPSGEMFLAFAEVVVNEILFPLSFIR